MNADTITLNLLPSALGQNPTERDGQFRAQLRAIAENGAKQPWKVIEVKGRALDRIAADLAREALAQQWLELEPTPDGFIIRRAF